MVGVPTEDNLAYIVIDNRDFKDLGEHADVYINFYRGELLRYHYRFGHLPYNKLGKMAEADIISRRLAKVNEPKCAACMFGKKEKRVWHTKTQAHCWQHNQENA